MMAGYVELLAEEMTLRAATLSQPICAATCYIGGGTPSLLAAEEIAQLLSVAKSCYHLLPDAEVTLEANPGTITPLLLEGWLAAGVNRLSLGVQSLQDRFLQTLGRGHNAEQARTSFAMARCAGFTNIGIDLIHSIPGETPQIWHDDLKQAMELSPDHISVYPLSLEEGTPLQQQVQQGELVLPGEEDALQMFRDTASLLVEGGYEHYEIANFARPGFRSRHNQVYWQRSSYIGFGVNAHSFVPLPGWGSRWHNVESLNSYIGLLRQGTLPEEGFIQLSQQDAMAEWLFLGLRLLEGVSPDKFREEFGVALEIAYPGVVSRLVKAGLLVGGERVRLTGRGLELANEVFRSFI